MGLFTKKADPIASKAKALNDQIAALELEIKQLNRKAQKSPEPYSDPIPHPVVRSTATPHSSPKIAPRIVPRDPIFESIEQAAPQGAVEETPERYNQLGVRKYDLPAAWRKFLNYFRGPAAHNPKLVSYLAAGSIRGLRPLRYEKRIARNRFIIMSVFFLGILWWFMAVLWRHR